jgi:hypothetical protein
LPPGLLVIRLAIAVALLPLALDWRSPLLAGVRPAALALLIATPLILIAIDGWLVRTKPQSRFRRALSVAVLLVAGVFVGARNVEGLSADAIRGQIGSWQDTRRRQGLPPLEDAAIGR